MKTLLAILLFSGQAFAAVPYWQNVPSTGTGTSTTYLSGTMKIYPSTASAAASPAIMLSPSTGISVSSNVYIVGFSSAAKYYGDGSSLTGTGDNLGNHTATTDLNMNYHNISGAGTITGTYYIDGSGTILRGSNAGQYIKVGSEAGSSSSGVGNTFLGVYSGNLVTTGVGNTFLGYNAGGNVITSGAYNIAIGHDRALSSGANYQLDIGGLITGDMTAGASSATVQGILNVSSNVFIVGYSSATKYYGDGSALTGVATSGGVLVSTFTLNLISGGDVFVASGTFLPNMGSEYMVTQATWNITGVRCFTNYVSTVGPTSFNIAYSTDTGATTTYSYLYTSSITVQQNSKFSAWAGIPDNGGTITIWPTVLSLHTFAIPGSGTLPQEYGCVIKYWRRLD